MQQIKRNFEILPNKSCGLHVNVSFEDMDTNKDLDYIMLFYLFNEQKYKLNTRINNELYSDGIVPIAPHEYFPIDIKIYEDNTNEQIKEKKNLINKFKHAYRKDFKDFQKLKSRTSPRDYEIGM
jgi:hypothetical protein